MNPETDEVAPKPYIQSYINDRLYIYRLVTIVSPQKDN